MHPIICKLGPLTLYSYGLILVFAFSIAISLASFQTRRYGLSPDLISNLSFIVIISGIIGARLLYVILNLDFYINNPIEIFMLSHGGLAWFGGLISGLVFCVVYLRYKKQDVYKIFDLLIPYVALAQAIGRIGCFLNGCCFGKRNLFFGIYFPVHDAILIPTQLYSCLALLVIYFLLRKRQEMEHRKGEILYLYLLFYAVWRFFIEFFRGDSRIFIFGLSIFQLISIALFVFATVMLARPRNH